MVVLRLDLPSGGVVRAGPSRGLPRGSPPALLPLLNPRLHRARGEGSSSLLAKRDALPLPSQSVSLRRRRAGTDALRVSPKGVVGPLVYWARCAMPPRPGRGPILEATWRTGAKTPAHLSFPRCGGGTRCLWHAMRALFLLSARSCAGPVRSRSLRRSLGRASRFPSSRASGGCLAWEVKTLAQSSFRPPTFSLLRRFASASRAQFWFCLQHGKSTRGASGSEGG